MGSSIPLCEAPFCSDTTAINETSGDLEWESNNVCPPVLVLGGLVCSSPWASSWKGWDMRGLSTSSKPSRRSELRGRPWCRQRYDTLLGSQCQLFNQPDNIWLLEVTFWFTILTTCSLPLFCFVSCFVSQLPVAIACYTNQKCQSWWVHTACYTFLKTGNTHPHFFWNIYKSWDTTTFSTYYISD